jgi:hypothetical protein
MPRLPTDEVVNHFAIQEEAASQGSQSCSDVSTLLYTVSENAVALYTRYVEGEEKLAERGVQTAQKCFEALKQKGTSPR